MRVHLSASFIAGAICPPGRQKIDFFDTKQRGFLLEVRASGGKTFYQRYTDLRGRERQIKIGPADVLSLGAARKKALEIAAKALVGPDPSEQKTYLRTIPTLSDFVTGRFLPYVKSHKRSWKTDETLLRLHILPRLGRTYIDQISSEPIT